MKALEKFEKYIEGVFFPSVEDLDEIIGCRIVEGGDVGERFIQDGSQGEQERKHVRTVELQAFTRISKTEIIKQENLNAIMKEAKQNTLIDTQADDNDIDVGWILKFLDLAGNISNEMLQKVWGKILSQKIKNSSSISLHSLMVIANLSLNAAETFKKISKYVIRINGENVLLNDSEFNKKYGIDYADILSLDEYGLINSSGMISMKSSLSEVANWSVQYGDNVAWGCSAKRTELRLQVFTLREAGNDLMSIVDVESDEKYFEDVRDYITKKNSSISFAAITKSL